MRNLKAAAPAVIMSGLSMVLTLAVVVLWLGQVMPWWVAAVVGLAIDGGWLTVLAYERRLSAQGDHSALVSAAGWVFGVVATGVLVAHALGEPHPAGWLAVAWLPVGAKMLWLVHGLWENTALTPRAIHAIAEARQESRDSAAVARAVLRAQTVAEGVRLESVSEAATTVSRAQQKAALRLSAARDRVSGHGTGQEFEEAMAAVSAPDLEARWALPVLGPVTPVSARPDNMLTGPVTSTDTVRTSESVAGLVRTAVAAGQSDADIVSGVLRSRPDSGPDSVLRAVRRERKRLSATGEGGYL